MFGSRTTPFNSLTCKSSRKPSFIDTGNIGIYADFSQNEDDKAYKQFLKENEEGHDKAMKDFIKKHPLPSQEDGIKNKLFWMMVVEDCAESSGVDKNSVRFCAEFDIIRRMYEHILEALNLRGGQVLMMINHYLSARCIRLNNPNNELKIHQWYFTNSGGME